MCACVCASLSLSLYTFVQAKIDTHARERIFISAQRIQPESKMPEEEIIPKRSGPPPEEEV